MCEYAPAETVSYCPNEDIDLVQFWFVLMRRRYLVVVIFLMCIVGGFVLAFRAPVKYIFTTSIEIGTTLTSNGVGTVSRPIESPDMVLAKLKETYIPLAVAQMLDEHSDSSFDVQVKNPKESNLIVLTSKGIPEMAESLRALHTQAIKPLLEDHRRILAVPYRDYEILASKENIKLKALKDMRVYVVEEKNLTIQLSSAKMKSADLDDRKNLLLFQEKRLAETQELLRQQIAKIEENLARAHANWPKAIANVGGSEAQAMTLLMITSQIEMNERRLSELQERLNIGLENQKQILQKDVAENRRAWVLQKEQIEKLQSQLTKLKVQRESEQELQQKVVASIENKLASLIDTRILGAAVRSGVPSGPGKSAVLAAAGILGLVLGVVVVFFLEFFNNVGRQTG